LPIKTSFANALMNVLIRCLILLFSITALASPRQPTPEDFAWGFPLSVQGRYDVYELELPEKLYRSVTDPELGDLRVFDAQGGLVPSILIRNRKPDSTTPIRKQVPFFPLYQTQSPDAKSPAEIQIETEAGGAIIKLQTDTWTSPRHSLWGYLIDLSHLDRQVQSLELQWQGAGDSFFTQVSIEHSDDLQRWQPLLETVTLAELRFDGRRIHRNTMEFPRVPMRYLRLHWPAGLQGVLLTGITAVVAQTPVSLTLHWTTLQSTSTLEENGKIHFLYDSQALLPVVRLRVSLPRENSLATLRLESQPDEKAPWRHRYQGLVYRLKRKGGELLSDDIVIPVTTDRYWRLTPIDALSQGDRSPLLKLGWHPHRLRFAANGRKPYLIACGNARMPPLPGSFERPLRKMLGQIPETSVGRAFPADRIPLGDPSLLRPQSPLPWRRWLLWAVLVLGVGVVALMVRSLYKEMLRQ